MENLYFLNQRNAKFIQSLMVFDYYMNFAAKESKVEQKSEKPEIKTSEKKPPPKKKKEIPKQILDDFALFSTPDIIRRVGGKDVKDTLDGEPQGGKPAKISDVNRSKSGDTLLSPSRSRNSIDSKIDKEKEAKDSKHRERRVSNSEMSKQSIDEKHTKTKENKTEKISVPPKVQNVAENILIIDQKPTGESIRSIIMNENTNSFTTGSIPMDTEIANNDSQNLDPDSMNLDTTGLDLDPTLLDNLNNDELSEDILYQVAQSLVSNPELQNAIDKGINEGVLDPNVVTPNQSFTEQVR